MSSVSIKLSVGKLHHRRQRRLVEDILVTLFTAEWVARRLWRVWRHTVR